MEITMTQDDIRELHAETETRRAAARKAFWSDHPLNLTYRQVVGPTFSLKSFIAFVVAMPREQFDACTIETADHIADRLLRDFFKPQI